MVISWYVLIYYNDLGTLSTPKSITITTNSNGVANTDINIWNFIIYIAYCTDSAAHIIIPFAVGNSWWVKVLNWGSNVSVTNTTVNIRLYGRIAN